MCFRSVFYYIFFIFVYLEQLFLYGTDGIGEIVYAVNCGGDEHIDINGVHYRRDSNRIGIASDFGKQFFVDRVGIEDQILYQTERYHTATFGYDIPVRDNGWYVLILKFSEVYFTAPNMKVFDVVLNGDVNIASDLDIFEKVGRGVAHDELTEFQIKDGKIFYDDGESEITGGMIRVEFIKTYRDNPKINAIVLMKGRLSDWPELPPPSVPADMEEEEEEGENSNVVNSDRSARRSHASKPDRNPSGPKSADPYQTDDKSSVMLPIFVAISAFIPLVICLCKM